MPWKGACDQLCSHGCLFQLGLPGVGSLKSSPHVVWAMSRSMSFCSHKFHIKKVSKSKLKLDKLRNTDRTESVLSNY